MIQSARANGTLGLRPPRVLIVGDDGGHVRAALNRAAPQLAATDVGSVFDALIELQGAEFGALLVNVEPLEHRPEQATRSLRQQLDAQPTPRPARLILFGSPSHEPVARETLDYGADDYVLLPAQPEEIREALLTRPVDLANQPEEPAEARTPIPSRLLPELPLASIVLDALLHGAGTSLASAVTRINTYLPTATHVEVVEASSDITGDPARRNALVVPLARDDASSDEQTIGDDRVLLLHVPRAADEGDRERARHDLQKLATELRKLADLDVRHVQLQRLALTDDLTGCYNRRYFRHFLEKILLQGRAQRFPVTLLLFDLDDFKHYNDRHGHRVGDAILKQTAEVIKRCVRDHDLVARIGGDEFAVVFWEKDSPRVPHDPSAASGGRFPRGPLQIADRFRRLMADPDFFALGTTGQGSLTISGGMAVFPFDAQTADELIEAADRALVFGSKRSGKNSITLVDEDRAGEAHAHLAAGDGA